MYTPDAGVQVIHVLHEAEVRHSYTGHTHRSEANNKMPKALITASEFGEVRMWHWTGTPLGQMTGQSIT